MFRLPDFIAGENVVGYSLKLLTQDNRYIVFFIEKKKTVMQQSAIFQSMARPLLIADPERTQQTTATGTLF